MSGADGYAGALVDRDGAPVAVVTRPASAGGGVLPLSPSLEIARHSPSGFAWGYGGSGPAQLALALILDSTGRPEVASALYRSFAADVVARWPWQPGGRWLLPAPVLDGWIVAAARRSPALARTLGASE